MLDAVLAALGHSVQPLPVLPSSGHEPEAATTPLQDVSILLQTLLDHLPEGVAIAYGPPDFPVIASSRGLDELGVEHLPLHRASQFGETVRDQELVVARPDGTRMTVLVDAEPISTRAGEVVGAVASWRDITAIKQAENASRLVEAQLREADARKDEFLGILAHELRGPLSPIRNVAHLLKLMGAGEPRLRKVSDILDRQVTAITRLLDDLLDFSNMTRGKLSLSRKPIELVSVIDQAIEWNQAVIESKRQRLVVDYPPGPIVVHADPVRLAQVVSNLLGNAAKFTDAEGRIWISVARSAEEVVVRVRDTGPGLEPSDLNNIFDLFYQLERTVDRTGRGLGIGLALVRRLVEMHGGSVEASSDGAGHGSEFRVRLPLLLPAGDLHGPALPSQRTGRAST